MGVRDSKGAAAPRLARPFVLLLLTAMVAAAIFVWEPWPITSFRLFSHLRQDEQTGWAAAAVGAGDRSGPLVPASLGTGYGGFSFRMEEFEGASTSRRDEICRAWVAPLAEGAGATDPQIRLYHLHWRLSRRTDDRERPAPPRRTLTFVCTATGARTVGAAG